jgi:hypothetical protein
MNIYGWSDPRSSYRIFSKVTAEIKLYFHASGNL